MATTRHLCDIKQGYRSSFWGHLHIIVMRDDGSEPPYAIRIDSIKPGDLLPRESDRHL